ncbi:MAG: hypothetical protein P4L35_00400 [Ignavibacteriaceae bacterium]|nr:hypothetical protein [Ignavibacteriaceae bacterium]
MKKIVFIIVIGLAFTSFAQYKSSGLDSPDIKDGIVDHSASGNLFGFLNSDNFLMKHSFDMSYSSFGGQGLALGVYTNSMFFKINPELNVQTDISIVNSPYSSLGKNFQNNLNGIYLSRAAINYQPFKDVSISLQYRNIPGAYNPYMYDGLGSLNGFGRSYDPWGY